MHGMKLYIIHFMWITPFKIYSGIKYSLYLGFLIPCGGDRISLGSAELLLFCNFILTSTNVT